MLAFLCGGSGEELSGSFLFWLWFEVGSDVLDGMVSVVGLFLVRVIRASDEGTLSASEVRGIILVCLFLT